MKTFLSYRHTGEDKAVIEPLLTAVRDSLYKNSVLVASTFFDTHPKERGGMTPRDFMLAAFKAIDGADFLFVIIASEQKSEGMLMEVGYCLAKQIPVVVAVKQGLNGTYLPQMADYKFEWTDLDDLAMKIEAQNFEQLLSSVIPDLIGNPVL